MAVRSLPRVPQYGSGERTEDHCEPYSLGAKLDHDWSASSFQAMSIASNPVIDMEMSPDSAFHRYESDERCIEYPERRSSIDAPRPWHTSFLGWHSRPGPLPYDLHIPNEQSSGTQWTRLEQDTSCSGADSWTSESPSEGDGCMKHQISLSHDFSEPGIHHTHMMQPMLFPEDLPYPGAGCAAVISPHALQQYPDTEEFGEDMHMKTDLHDVSANGRCSPVDSGICVPYSQQDLAAHEDEGVGSSLPSGSQAASIHDRSEDEDSAMGGSDPTDDDDDYSPKRKPGKQGRRLSQRSATTKSPTLVSSKRTPRIRSATSQSAKPTKIAKKSSKPPPTAPVAGRTGNKVPCSQCALDFASESTLKKHVLASHTRPFICTFHNYGCTSTVGSKNEWKRHINVQHMHLETWRCDIGACASKSGGSKENKRSSPSPSGQLQTNGPAFHEFDRKDLFTQHLKRMHAPSNSASRADKDKFDASIEGIQRRCHKKLRTPPTNAICPYCTHHPVFESWEDRIEHVGKHLERGDIDRSQEMEDTALKTWLQDQGYLVWKGQTLRWRLVDTGKKKKNREEKAMADDEEDAEGEEE